MKVNLRSEASGIAEEVDKGDTDDSVDVQNQIGLLRRRDFLHFQGVVQQRRCWKVLLHKFLLETKKNIKFLLKMFLNS